MAGRDKLIIRCPVEITYSLRVVLYILNKFPGVNIVECVDFVEMDGVIFFAGDSAVITFRRKG